MIARDDGYPQLTDQASVQINIIRDQFTPTFSRNDYFVTILETANINETITNVVATDEDRQVSSCCFCYASKVVFSYNATHFFRQFDVVEIKAEEKNPGYSFNLI